MPEAEAKEALLADLLDSPPLHRHLTTHPIGPALPSQQPWACLRAQIDPSTPEAEAKEALLAEVAEYMNARISVADRLLVGVAVNKVGSRRVVQ